MYMTGDARTHLREAPISSFQIMIVVITTALNMIDGFDVLAISFTAPLIAKEWGVPPATLGILLSAGLAGMALGSPFLSPGADLFGTRAVLIAATPGLIVGTLAARRTRKVLSLVCC